MADELDVKLSSEEKVRLHPTRKINPEAYEAYLIGNHIYDYVAVGKAIPYYELAIRKDPAFAQAYASLAESENFISYTFERPLTDRAVNAATKAMELDPDSAESHQAIADVYLYRDWNWIAAEAEYRRAVELEPNSAGIAGGYAEFLRLTGRWDAALREARRALQFEPTSRQTNDTILDTLICARRYEEALEQYKRCRAMNPSAPLPDLRLGGLYESQGKDKEALDVYLKRLGGTEKESLDWYSKLQFKTLVDGEVDDKQLERLRRAAAAGGLHGYYRELIRAGEASKHPIRFVALANLYCRLGEKENAIEALERAVEQHSPRLIDIYSYAIMAPLHSDPRYQAILKKIHFPE